MSVSANLSLQLYIGNFWSRSKNCIYGHTIRLPSLVCVCVVGYVTKWGICPSGLYLNYSISCPRRPDLIEVARGVWSSHTSLGTSGERSISNNLSENIAISATYITSWLLKGLGLSVWVPRAQQWSEVRSGIDCCGLASIDAMGNNLSPQCVKCFMANTLNRSWLTIIDILSQVRL